jgi:hypothetical protein
VESISLSWVLGYVLIVCPTSGRRQSYVRWVWPPVRDYQPVGPIRVVNIRPIHDSVAFTYSVEVAQTSTHPRSLLDGTELLIRTSQLTRAVLSASLQGHRMPVDHSPNQSNSACFHLFTRRVNMRYGFTWSAFHGQKAKANGTHDCGNTSINMPSWVLIFFLSIAPRVPPSTLLRSTLLPLPTLSRSRRQQKLPSYHQFPR